MISVFSKFPSTPHLALLEGVSVRDDKVMMEAERTNFLNNIILVEEKIDGANLGISFDTSGKVIAQNRGAQLHLPSSGQWKKLSSWLEPKKDRLYERLLDRFIVFGEWCYAKHSIYYDRLPDWFLAFDVFDKIERKFLSAQRRNDILDKTLISRVPTIRKGRFTLNELEALLTESKLGEAPAEGLYLRVDDSNWLLKRAKLVRPSFMQMTDHHWSRSKIIPNRLSMTNSDWNTT